MTNIFSSISIIPDRKICLVADINPDGIGDLMLQIKLYHILNRKYPGKVFCISFIEKNNLEKYQAIASAHEFPTGFFDIVSSRQWTHEVFSDKDVSLIIQISYIFNPQPLLNPRVRHYEISEIKYNHNPFRMREKIGNLGFLPECEGLLLDDAPSVSNPIPLLMNLSNILKSMLECHAFLNTAEADRWYQSTWIAQSGHYQENHFMISLLSQLKYIKDSCPHISRVIIKYHGQNRDTTPWRLLEKLQTTVLNKLLIDLNVKYVIHDGVKIMVCESNTMTVNLGRDFLPLTDYQTFLHLLNGCYFPSGDNSYGEAWSICHTRLPPFPEFRDYKQATITKILDIVENLNIDESSRDLLADHYAACLIMHARFNNTYDEARIIEFSQKIAFIWSRHDRPQFAWQAFFQAIREHNLSKRILSIVKEQLLFAKHPDLVDIKYQLITSGCCDAIEKYQTIIKSMENSQMIRAIASSSKSYNFG